MACSLFRVDRVGNCFGDVKIKGTYGAVLAGMWGALTGDPRSARYRYRLMAGARSAQFRAQIAGAAIAADNPTSGPNDEGGSR